MGSLVQALDDHDILDRTLIVLSSDHGEAFMEHGFEGHARNLYRETVHVPFLIIPCATRASLAATAVYALRLRSAFIGSAAT